MRIWLVGGMQRRAWHVACNAQHDTWNASMERDTRHTAQSTTRGTPRRAAGESVRMKRVCAAASAAFPPHTARRCSEILGPDPDPDPG